MSTTSESMRVIYSILHLPAEMLVFIISFLSSRDVVTLRYVSKNLRVFTEVPSLWTKFSWPYYRSCEEASVIEILKVCGNHIQQLSFTNDHYLTSKLCCDLILTNCANVINLTLLIQSPLTKYVLEKFLQNLKHLKKLEISWSGEVFYPASLLKNSNLTEVTLYLARHISKPSNDHENCLHNYISAGHKPQYVNIVQNSSKHNRKSVERSVFRYLLRWWSTGNSTRDQYRPPDGYTAHFKLYDSCRVPFNVFPTLPHLHIQFSLTPSVIVYDLYYCLLGQRHYSLKLNHCSCSNRNCNCIVASASVNESVTSYYGTIHGFQFYHNAAIWITQFANNIAVSINDMKSVLDKNLEQVSSLFPNLQRLDLSFCNVSKDNMRGLRAVAKNCRNLKGLRLRNTHAMILKNTHVITLNLKVLWEILYSMKLTHLSIEHCLLTSTAVDNHQEMVSLCTTLQALEIRHSDSMCCEVCKWSYNEDLSSLSQFSSLQYCRVHHYYNSNVVQDITISSKQLKCIIIELDSFYEQSPFHPTGFSLSSTFNNNLEQLFINSRNAIVSDEFMKAVSAHGGLIHVTLKVATITEKGVGILIENSPKLQELLIDLSKSVHEQNGGFDPSILNIILKEKYKHQLVTEGHFVNRNKFNGGIIFAYFLFSKILTFRNTDLRPVWPNDAV